MAEQLMVRERGSHTQQPTALEHEAFLLLVDAEKAGERGRLHFLGAAAVTMRRVLVDHRWLLELRNEEVICCRIGSP